MFLGGLLINYDKIPGGWEWFSWTSFLRYSWGMILLNQFEDSGPGTVEVFVDETTLVPITVLEFYGFREGVMVALHVNLFACSC